MKSETQVQSQKESSSEKLTEIKQIRDTPFNAVKCPDGWLLTLGKYRLSELMVSEEEIVELVRPDNWDLLFKVIQIFIENKN